VVTLSSWVLAPHILIDEEGLGDRAGIGQARGLDD